MALTVLIDHCAHLLGAHRQTLLATPLIMNPPHPMLGMLPPVDHDALFRHRDVTANCDRGCSATETRQADLAPWDWSGRLKLREIANILDRLHVRGNLAQAASIVLFDKDGNQVDWAEIPAYRSR